MQPCHVLLHRTGWSTQAGGGPAPRAAVPGKEAQTQRVIARDMKPGLRARWHRPGILALRRPGQEGCKLHTCLVHAVSSAPARPRFKERKEKQNNPLSFRSLTRFIRYHTRKMESTEALEKRWIWNGESSGNRVLLHMREDLSSIPGKGRHHGCVCSPSAEGAKSGG